MLPKLAKFDIENVVLTMFNVVYINVLIDNINSTLFNIENLNVDVGKVVSTFIWSYPASRSHINQKNNIKKCWNVCWECWTGKEEEEEKD